MVLVCFNFNCYNTVSCDKTDAGVSKYGLYCSVKSCFKGNELGLIFLQHCIAGLKKLMYVGKFKRLPIMEAS